MTDRRLLYVLALLEAGLSALATLGGIVFMRGNPIYIGIGILFVIVYVVAGQAASRGRWWGLMTLIIAECVRLTGFGLSTIAGLLPWVQLSLTGATLTDSLILPAIVVVMAAIQVIQAAPPPAPAPPPKPELVPPVPTPTLALPTESVA